MLSNLLFYGFACGFGFTMSYLFSDVEKRSIWLYLASAILPVCWMIIVPHGEFSESRAWTSLANTFDIEKQLPRFAGREAAVLFTLPFLWSFCTGGWGWIEWNRYKRRNEKD